MTRVRLPNLAISARFTKVTRKLGLVGPLTDLNIAVYRATGGKLLARLGRAPILLLTTTGRKSGRTRTTPVVYVREGDGWVVIGSYAASEKPPAWSLNLLDDPEAEVEVGRDRHQVRARIARGDERRRLWERMDEQYGGGFDKYDEDTERDLPVFVLERVEE